jgi:hypothetical protein
MICANLARRWQYEIYAFLLEVKYVSADAADEFRWSLQGPATPPCASTAAPPWYRYRIRPRIFLYFFNLP